MIRSTLAILFFFYSLSAFACSCSSAWDDSFKKTAKNSEFVALVKVVSFDEYLERKIYDHEGKMPYAMTVEIIKKYKGKEQREKFRITGDNGILCRPYLSEFEINGYYLISPTPSDNTINTDYHFYICQTDYLKVDFEANKAYGKYSLIRYRIDLNAFERKLENGDWDLAIVGSLGLLITIVLIKRRKRKRAANNLDKP